MDKTVKRPDRDTVHQFINSNSARKSIRIDDMVGLDSVKETLDMITTRIMTEKALAKRGLDIDPGPMNFVFTGNPGTAKTTVARLLAAEFHEKGILPTRNVVCAGRKDIIARYEGETTRNMKDAFDRAKGGVLFIDEAYSLVERWDSRDSGGYGKEAIDTLVEELGVPRNDRVVILAGYPEEMEEFIRTNPGLSSRLNYRINFPDYNAEELFSIIKLHAGKDKLTINEAVKDGIMPKLEEACKSKCFGNGRFAVNLLNKAVNRQRARLCCMGVESVSNEDAMTLMPEDFVDIDAMLSALKVDSGKEAKKKTRKAIGFTADRSL